MGLGVWSGDYYNAIEAAAHRDRGAPAVDVWTSRTSWCGCVNARPPERTQSLSREVCVGSEEVGDASALVITLQWWGSARVGGGGPLHRPSPPQAIHTLTHPTLQMSAPSPPAAAACGLSSQTGPPPGANTTRYVHTHTMAVCPYPYHDGTSMPYHVGRPTSLFSHLPVTLETYPSGPHLPVTLETYPLRSASLSASRTLAALMSPWMMLLAWRNWIALCGVCAVQGKGGGASKCAD